jgi:uncharacterized protein
MTEQVRARDERLAGSGGSVRTGALAVTTGPGMARLFESLGVRALDGGPTANPSTYELLAAIHAIPAEEVVVLPNSPNVIMAAERAAALSDRIVKVVPSRSPQAGLAAAISLDHARTVEENAQVMETTLERVRTGAVAPAARDDVQGRFRQGDALGFVDEKVVVWGDPRAALQGVVERLAVDAELITLLRGADAPLDDQTVYELARDGVELELSEGGQPNYWWLLSAE